MTKVGMQDSLTWTLGRWESAAYLLYFTLEPHEVRAGSCGDIGSWVAVKPVWEINIYVKDSTYVYSIIAYSAYLCMVAIQLIISDDMTLCAK